MGLEQHGRFNRSHVDHPRVQLEWIDRFLHRPDDLFVPVQYVLLDGFRGRAYLDTHLVGGLDTMTVRAHRHIVRATLALVLATLLTGAAAPALGADAAPPDVRNAYSDQALEDLRASKENTVDVGDMDDAGVPDFSSAVFNKDVDLGHALTKVPPTAYLINDAPSAQWLSLDDGVVSALNAVATLEVPSPMPVAELAPIVSERYEEAVRDAEGGDDAVGGGGPIADRRPWHYGLDMQRREQSRTST